MAQAFRDGNLEIYLDTATGIQVRQPGDILEYRPDEDEESR